MHLTDTRVFSFHFFKYCNIVIDNNHTVLDTDKHTYSYIQKHIFDE